ncbi:MAG: hypothetical protein ACI861_001842 [Paracoccaceae bacterium]|jgi:hypothetical protein
MDQPFEFDTETDSDIDIDGQNAIVYVRAVAVRDLPEDLRTQSGDTSEGVSWDTAIIYSVHDTDGQRLALVGDRKLAFALARQYDFVPVNVH